MKRLFVFGLCLGFGILILGFSLAGCGGQAGEEAAPTTTTAVATTTTTAGGTTTTTAAAGTTTTTVSTTTTTVAGATFSISGSFNTGNIAGAGISAAGMRAQAMAFAPVSGYTIVAADEDGGIHFPDKKTDASGNFTVSHLDAGKSHHVVALDPENRVAGLIAFGATTNEVVMAIRPPATTPEATYNLGQIVYEAAKGTAVPTQAPISILSNEEGDRVPPKSEEILVPPAAGNFGKGEEAEFSGPYDSNEIDGDKDGAQNPFDANNNGDSRLDEFDGLSTMETLSNADTKIAFSGIWTNVKVPYGATQASVLNNATGYWVIISVEPKDGYTITSVSLEAETSAIWAENARIHQSNGADAGSSWCTVGYKLYSQAPQPNFQVMLGGAEIAPGTIVKAGDILTFIVTFSDNSSEKIAKMINFAIADVPKLKGYYYGQWSSTDDFTSQYLPEGMSNKMLTENPVNTSVFSLKWQKASDESSAYLEGATYAWEVGQGNFIYPQITTEVGSPYVYGHADLASSVLTTAESFVCAIGMISSGGDNAVQNCAFAKTTTWGTTEVGGPPKP